MCGIVYQQSFKGFDVTNAVLNQFKIQQSRGTTSFGFYLPNQDRLTHNVNKARIKALMKRTKNEEILFHHRFSTSTPDVRNACHPFSTKNHFENNYVGVHNGVISNSRVLYDKHKELGIEYVSMQPDGRFNDSEALIYDIAMFIEGKVDKLTAQGSDAFILVQRGSDGKRKALYFGRNNGNPLKMLKTDFSLMLSSEGKGELIDPNKLYRFDYDTKEVTFTELKIPYYEYSGNTASGSWINGRFVYNDTKKKITGTANTNAKTGTTEGGFEYRLGDEKTITNQFIKENRMAVNQFASASIAAVLELEQVRVEIANIDRQVEDLEYSNNHQAYSYNELYNEWYFLTEYEEMLNNIVDYLEKLGRDVEKWQKDKKKG